MRLCDQFWHDGHQEAAAAALQGMRRQAQQRLAWPTAAGDFSAGMAAWILGAGAGMGCLPLLLDEDSCGRRHFTLQQVGGLACSRFRRVGGQARSHWTTLLAGCHSCM